MSTIPVKLEPISAPPIPPKNIAGQSLTPEQVQKLFNLLKTGYPPFLSFPVIEGQDGENNVPNQVVFLHIQADASSGGVINIGYN